MSLLIDEDENMGFILCIPLERHQRLRKDRYVTYQLCTSIFFFSKPLKIAPIPWVLGCFILVVFLFLCIVCVSMHRSLIIHARGMFWKDAMSAVTIEVQHMLELRW